MDAQVADITSCPNDEGIRPATPASRDGPIPRDFAAAIERIVCDEPLLRTLSQGALGSVAGRSWEALIDPLESLPMQPRASLEAFVH